MEQSLIAQYLGPAAWILLLIPLVLIVRLVSKRSRWSRFHTSFFQFVHRAEKTIVTPLLSPKFDTEIKTKIHSQLNFHAQ